MPVLFECTSNFDPVALTGDLFIYVENIDNKTACLLQLSIEEKLLAELVNRTAFSGTTGGPLPLYAYKFSYTRSSQQGYIQISIPSVGLRLLAHLHGVIETHLQALVSGRNVVEDHLVIPSFT